VLLITLVLLLVIYPLLFDAFETGILYSVVLTCVTFAAIFAVFAQRRVRLLAMLLAVPVVAGSWTGFVVSNVHPTVSAALFHGVAILFLGMVVAEVLRSIYRHETITTDSVCGAFCGYVVLGVALREEERQGGRGGAALDLPSRDHHHR
jgi:hypothetical protein